MIAGIGTDMIEIGRVEKACAKEAFFLRVFSQEERNMIGTDWKRAAGNFAVKESVAKMFGTGFRGIQLKEIEVLRDELGKPYVILSGMAKERADEQHVGSIHVSITNTKEYASAFVVGEIAEQA